MRVAFQFTCPIGANGALRALRVPLGGGPVVIVDGNGIPVADALPAGVPSVFGPILYHYLREWSVIANMSNNTVATSEPATWGDTGQANTAANNNTLVVRRPSPGPGLAAAERPWDGLSLFAESNVNAGVAPNGTGTAPSSNNWAVTAANSVNGKPVRASSQIYRSVSSGGSGAFAVLGPDCYMEFRLESNTATPGTALVTVYITGDPISPDR